MNHQEATAAVREASLSTGDASGNCDEALYAMENECFEQAAQLMEWAEKNARSALHRITEARAAITKAQQGGSK